MCCKNPDGLGGFQNGKVRGKRTRLVPLSADTNDRDLFGQSENYSTARVKALALADFVLGLVQGCVHFDDDLLLVQAFELFDKRGLRHENHEGTDDQQGGRAIHKNASYSDS